MKREVRQRSGFGCVVCGVPLYTYEHITPWAEVNEHTAENLTLLCPNHQQESTAGILPKDKIRAFTEEPYNLRHGHSTPYPFHFTGSDGGMEIEAGGNWFIHHESVAVFIIDNIPLLGFRRSNDEVLLTIRLIDEFNRPTLLIEDNEMIYSTMSWDVEFSGGVLTVRSRPGTVQARIRFEPPMKVIVESALFRLNGVLIDAKPGGIVVPSAGVTARGNMFAVQAGYAIGSCPNFPSAAIRFDVDRCRTGHSGLIPES
jgi:trigger factor